MRATRIPIGLFVALLALTSCDGTMPQEPAPPAVLVLEPVTPVSVTGVVGQEIAVAPVVLVTQADGVRAKDVPVLFVAGGGGSVGSASVKTDAAGRATPGTWRLGRGAEVQTLTAHAAGRSLVFSANARPGPITTLAMAGGNGQWATVGTSLPAPVRVRATDGYGNVVSDAEVTFAVVDGGGSLAPGASITGVDGIAESKWTLGTTAGTQHVRAQTGEGRTAEFMAGACPSACSSELAHELDGNIVLFDAVTGSTRQVMSEGQSYDPAWSPDGERIAFTRYILGDEPRWSIHVINSDGSGVRPVSVTAPGFFSPSWSPQGDALAFSGYPSSNCPGNQYCGAIYVQELSEGSAMRQVAPSGFEPAWSPDGSRIVFVRHNGLINDEDYYSLRLVNRDGSGPTDITPRTWFPISRPAWSPDGTRIAFAMSGTIYVVRADGTGQTPLTTGWGADAPAWSPDGTRIAYGTNGNRIMQIPAEGGEPTFMTFGSSPSWRP